MSSSLGFSSDCYRVLLGFTCFIPSSPRFTGFRWVLVGFHWVLLDSIGLEADLAEFLPGFT